MKKLILMVLLMLSISTEAAEFEYECDEIRYTAFWVMSKHQNNMSTDEILIRLADAHKQKLMTDFTYEKAIKVMMKFVVEQEVYTYLIDKTLNAMDFAEAAYKACKR